MTGPMGFEGGCGAEVDVRGNGDQRVAAIHTRLDDRAVVDIALDELEDSPFQVKQYDDLRVKDLAETIRKQGCFSRPPSVE